MRRAASPGTASRFVQRTEPVHRAAVRRILALPLLLVWASLMPASPVGAQITGVTVDGAGAPVSGVVVEAWSDDGHLASRITGDDGRFRFPPEVADRATRLRAGRLGYRPLVERVDPGAGTHRLRLEEEPIPLEELVVRSEQRRCTADEEDGARELWDALRSRYSGPMDTVGVATYLARAEKLVSRDEVGPLELPSEMLQQRGSSSQLRFSWTRQVRRGGYAFPVRRTERGRSFDSWTYAPLEADFAPHFVDPVFGELHRFRVRDRGDFGWLLEFCPRDTGDPSIRGTMRIGRDTSLLSVEWQFETPEPDEDAGGRAFFPPTTGPPARNHPLPTESLFWRRMPGGEFQEIHQRFERWIVAQGDTVPFLPPRKN